MSSDIVNDGLALEEAGCEDEGVELDLMIAEGSVLARWKHKVAVKKKPLLCIAAIGVFALLVLVAAGITTGLAVGLTGGTPEPQTEDYVLYIGDEEPFTRNKPGKEDIVTTREYQVSLYPKRFRNRDNGVDEMLVFLEPYLGVSLRHAGNLTIWREHHYKTSKCGGHSYSELRSRDVLYSTFPDFVETTVFTLKENTGKNGAGKASETKYLPSDAYAEGSVQKVEEDVHPCKHKFSRKSMVVSNVEFGETIDTCQGLQQIYPHAYNEQEDDTQKVTLHSTSYWWVKSIEGFLPETDGWEKTHFKIAFTLIYDDEESARTGAVLPHGETEWSIRLWSSEDGHGNWEEGVLKNMADTYVALLEEFGSDESSYPCH